MTGIRVDGEHLDVPTATAGSWSDLLSAELDTLVRDPIYEAAARAA